MIRRGALLFVIACSGGCRHESPRTILSEPSPTPAVALSWESLFTRTSGWTGADGAATVPLPGNKSLWLFGDTWIGPVINGRHAEGTTMVNNTIAICEAAATPPVSDDIRFLWGSAAGKPVAWATPQQQGEWFWPAGGAIIAPGPDGADRLLVFMTRLSRLDNSDSIWNFQVRGSTVLSISNPADDPARWRPAQASLNAVGTVVGRRVVTWGAAAVASPGMTNAPAGLLIYGIDATTALNKKLLIARAPAATIEQFDTWWFRTDSGWSVRETDATPVVENIASELSVHHLELGGTAAWLMVYSEPPMGADILARTAPAPEGPWSQPIALFTCPEPAADKRLFVYAAKAHPELSNTRPAGELLISYCVNSTDFWDVVAHADKYRPRFINIPLAAVRSGTR